MFIRQDEEERKKKRSSFFSFVIRSDHCRCNISDPPGSAVSPELPTPGDRISGAQPPPPRHGTAVSTVVRSCLRVNIDRYSLLCTAFGRFCHTVFLFVQMDGLVSSTADPVAFIKQPPTVCPVISDSPQSWINNKKFITSEHWRKTRPSLSLSPIRTHFYFLK